MTPSNTNKKDILILFIISWITNFLAAFILSKPEFYKALIISLILFATPIYYLFYRYFEKRWVRTLFILTLLPSVAFSIIIPFDNKISLNTFQLIYSSLTGIFYAYFITHILFIKKHLKSK